MIYPTRAAGSLNLPSRLDQISRFLQIHLAASDGLTMQQQDIRRRAINCSGSLWSSELWYWASFCTVEAKMLAFNLSAFEEQIW